MNIKGIGEKSFLKLKPLVTVGAEKAERHDNAGSGSRRPEASRRPALRRAGRWRDRDVSAKCSRVESGERRDAARGPLHAGNRWRLLGGIVIPLANDTVDALRTAAAARYVAARIGSVRMDAVRRASATALRFDTSGGDYRFASFEDGNGNGVRSAEIRDGIDRPLGPFERLTDKFPGVRFELMDGVPDADGTAGTGVDGVQDMEQRESSR